MKRGGKYPEIYNSNEILSSNLDTTIGDEMFDAEQELQEIEYQQQLNDIFSVAVDSSITDIKFYKDVISKYKSLNETTFTIKNLKLFLSNIKIKKKILQQLIDELKEEGDDFNNSAIFIVEFNNLFKETNELENNYYKEIGKLITYRNMKRLKGKGKTKRNIKPTDNDRRTWSRRSTRQ